MSIPVSATMPCSRSQSVHSGPRASRMSTARACVGRRLRPLVGDAVVADHRRGEADELVLEARVGDRLLVAGHAGREDGLAERVALGADRLAVPHRAVCEREVAHSNATFPPASVIRTAPVSRRAEQPRVARARAERLLADRPLAVEVEQDEVRRRARRDARPVEAEDPRRPGRHPLEQRLERQQPGLDEVRVERRERRLEAGHAERRRLERHVLLVRGVRRVVGRDRLDRPVAHRVEQRDAGRARLAAAGSSSRSGRASERRRR